jgi:hypothetical protein
MRFATCLLAALLTATTLTTQIAAACGGSYESVRRPPQLMVLSSHHVYSKPDGDVPSSTRRTFAITRANLDVGADAAWERLAPMTYDYTDVLSLANLTSPMTVTVVGESGTRVVRSNTRVALKNAMFISGSLFEGVELPLASEDRFEIALAGSHRDAVWHDLVGSYTYTNRIAGTNLSATHSYDDGKPMVALRAGKQDLGSYEGYVVGAVDVGGARYVVLKTRLGTAYTVEATK